LPRQKSKAQFLVADGTGGMRQVADLRFEAGEWPIVLVVPPSQAENWMAHFGAETEERGWNLTSFSQLDAAENSGTLSVHTTNGPTPATIDIVWERLRGKKLQLRARLSGESVLTLDDARNFINSVSARALAGKTLRAHRQAYLTYDSFPWRGELWLDNDHRLGPPSKHPDSLLGPQTIIVDAMVEGIGQQGVAASFQRRLHELRVFLSFVLGLRLEFGKFERGWVCDVNAEGRITECTLRNVGYAELSPRTEFPIHGCVSPVARRDVTRPGLGPYGIWPDMQEQWVPADIEQLWQSFLMLPSAKREHLLRAGNAFLIAASMWPDQRTAYAAFLVVACEALKPAGKRYDSMNVYDVVASLVSPNDAVGLRELSLQPQRIRSKHVHRGELVAGELLPMLMNNYFMDPSFHQMLRELSDISRICLIEWLRCGGTYRVVRIPHANSTRAARIKTSTRRKSNMK
jgi:hypothetical protein